MFETVAKLKQVHLGYADIDLRKSIFILRFERKGVEIE